MSDLQEIGVRGLKILIRPQTSDYKAIEETLIKDGYETKFFSIAKGEHWLDAGANIGGFSLLCGLNGASSIGYEPEPSNASLAQENLRRNQLSSKIVQAAIVPDSYEGNTVNLWLHPTPYGLWRHTIHRRGKQTQAVVVPVIRISEALNGVDCVKLDIEGAELNILDEISDWQNVRKLVFEYHFDTDSSVARYRKIVARLAETFTVKAPAIKEGVEQYTWFPQAKVIYCWR